MFVKSISHQRSSALIFAIDEYLYVPGPDSRRALTASDDSAWHGRVSRTSTAFFLAAVQIQHVAARAIVTLTKQSNLKEKEN